jgi:hypothetical protein
MVSYGMEYMGAVLLRHLAERERGTVRRRRSLGILEMAEIPCSNSGSLNCSSGIHSAHCRCNQSPARVFLRAPPADGHSEHCVCCIACVVCVGFGALCEHQHNQQRTRARVSKDEKRACNECTHTP